jgi:hypothetical protein
VKNKERHLEGPSPKAHRVRAAVQRGLVAAVVFVSFGSSAQAATLAETFETDNPASEVQLDNTSWQSFLDRYVVRGAGGINLVRYVAVTSQDRGALDGWLETMSHIDPADLTRDQQFAWWVNLYNALTVRLILDHYPIASIRDIDKFRLGSRGPWNDVLIEVRGHGLTLDNIEHDILRPLWNDARIHFVVNCASLGCPDLARQALSARDLEAQLEAAAASFINHPRAVLVSNGRLTVSSLFKWYREDFGGAGDAGLITWLGRYADPDLAADLAGMTRISKYHYDWDLNDAVGEATAPKSP